MDKEQETFRPDGIHDHERPLGRFQADALGAPFRPLKSLAEARAADDGVVILQGDDGGQVYVVCPASQVTCTESSLVQLLVDLDEIAWPRNDPDMRRIYYERLASGSRVSGGMGGGRVCDAPWIHPEFVALKLDVAIVETLRGARARIR